MSIFNLFLSAFRHLTMWVGATPVIIIIMLLMSHEQEVIGSFILCILPPLRSYRLVSENINVHLTNKVFFKLYHFLKFMHVFF